MGTRSAKCALAAIAIATASTPARDAAAWSLSRDAVRPALAAGRDNARHCALVHAAPSGRYVVWIDVDARGRGRVRLRDKPAATSRAAQRCLIAAYEAPRYPNALEATVAWSSTSPPQQTYRIALPIVIAVNNYGYEASSFAPLRVRPSPARSAQIEIN